MHVMVESEVYPSISDELAIYAADVERTGLGCAIWTVEETTDPTVIRSQLQGAFPEGLDGCLLVGNISAAWYHIHALWSDLTWDIEDFPCDLFYMDLDGDWDDSDSDGFYDAHTDGVGDIQPEIWVSRLKTDRLNGNEVDHLEAYFDKNHGYRTGAITFSPDALCYVDDDWEYWSSIYENSVEQAFNPVTLVDDKAITSKSDYMMRLHSSFTAVHVMCHGNPGSHTFKVPDGDESVWEGVSVGTVSDISTLDDNVLFYNLFICSSGRYTSDNFLAGWYVQSGDTLAATASTKTGGMLDELAFYTSIGDGSSVGDSFHSWLELSLESSSDSIPWYMGMAIIGDPTIRLSGKFPVSIEAGGLPSGTFDNAVFYVEDGMPKLGDIVDGHWDGQCDHGSVLIVDGSLDGGYTTDDPTQFTVVEPFTQGIDYYHQHQVDITFTGLTTAHPTTVHYVDHGDVKTFSAWDGAPFSRLCDHGTTVWVEDPVIVSAYEERYRSEYDETTSWVVNTDVSVNVDFYHQYGVILEVETVGVEEMDMFNDVIALYESSGHSSGASLYDGFAPVLWLDAGTEVTISLFSHDSTASHRWRTDDVLTYTASGPRREHLQYYEQYLMDIVSDGLASISYQGTANFVQFGDPMTGSYWNMDEWVDWCDVSTILSWDQIVSGPPCERYHNPGETSLLVAEGETIFVHYHTEFKITIVAEGLPDTEESVITIGVADPSVSDDVAGGDQTEFEVTLSSPTDSWTDWVHEDTELEATEFVEVADNEKYQLICWTVGGDRYAPPSVDADWPCMTYTAHYIGLKKEMSADEAWLTDPVMVHLVISCSSCIEIGDMLQLVDELPNELSFVVGSATLDGAPVTPTLGVITAPVKYQVLTFEDLEAGGHDIWFEVRVNRAYATDRSISNQANMDIELDELEPMSLGVLYALTVHPYAGPTLSSSIDGPTVVTMGTRTCWEFTFIVKNNFNYRMLQAVLRDYFGAELDFDPDSVMANLVTSPALTYASGEGSQVRLTWCIGTLEKGEAFMLQVTLCTDVNNGGAQEFSSDGLHALDSGALLKWLNNKGKQQSLLAPRIWVIVTDD